MSVRMVTSSAFLKVNIGLLEETALLPTLGCSKIQRRFRFWPSEPPNRRELEHLLLDQYFEPEQVAKLCRPSSCWNSIQFGFWIFVITWFVHFQLYTSRLLNMQLQPLQQLLMLIGSRGSFVCSLKSCHEQFSVNLSAGFRTSPVKLISSA